MKFKTLLVFLMIFILLFSLTSCGLQDPQGRNLVQIKRDILKNTYEFVHLQENTEEELYSIVSKYMTNETLSEHLVAIIDIKDVSHEEGYTTIKVGAKTKSANLTGIWKTDKLPKGKALVIWYLTDAFFDASEGYVIIVEGTK